MTKNSEDQKITVNTLPDYSQMANLGTNKAIIEFLLGFLLPSGVSTSWFGFIWRLAFIFAIKNSMDSNTIDKFKLTDMNILKYQWQKFRLKETIFEIFISSISCGIISGKPRMAINAAFCWALAAIADKKVNTRLRLTPPSMVMPANFNQ